MKKLAGIFILVLSFLIVSIFYLSSNDKVVNMKEIDKRILKKSAEKKPASEPIMSERKKRIKGITKTDSPNLFAEHERLIRTKDGEDIPGYEFNYRIKELLKAHKSKSVKEFTKKYSSLNKATGIQFVERGPGNVSGRTRGIVVDPDDPNYDTWYAGSVGGGVWKTTNAGQSWVKITPEIGNLATSTIVQSPSNPDVMYMGTGEGFGNVDQIDGSGIWKTTVKARMRNWIV